MTFLLTSGNPLGLRAVGSGGRTATASYEQITRTLRQTLGPDHAALFAEPSQRSAMVDWFAEGEAVMTPIRLNEAPPERRDGGLARLESLVGDIEAQAVSLRKSDRQDERILGDMLSHALEIPDEDAVFLVGEQPVMTFWGYVRDQGRPAVSPIRSLLRRRPPSPGATAPKTPPLPETSVLPPGGAAGAAVLVVPGRDLMPAVLWATFTLLLLACGVQLLRGCAIGLPHALTGWLIDACPARPDTRALAALADEQAKQAESQAEYDDLVRQAALKRQACFIKPPSPNITPRPKPAPMPDPIQKTQVEPAIDPKKDQLKIPPKKTSSADFLEGCWRAHEGLTENAGGKKTDRKLKVTYCFNKDGTGSRTIRYEEDNAKCVGPIKASWDADTLKVVMEDAPCERDHGHYNPAVDQCRRGDEGVARCDEVPQGETKPNFIDFPFTRTDEQP